MRVDVVDEQCALVDLLLKGWLVSSVRHPTSGAVHKFVNLMSPGAGAISAECFGSYGVWGDISEPWCSFFDCVNCVSLENAFALCASGIVICCWTLIFR